MKKLTICLMAILATSIFSISAQTKGEMYAGGSLGIGTTSLISKGNSATGVTFNIAPEFSYFVADNFKVGATVAYGIESNGTTTHTIQIMPNLAYYVRLCDKFYYTPGVELGFVCGISEGVSMPGFGVGLSLGCFEFRPTQKFALSVSLLSFDYMLLTYKGDWGKINVSGVEFRLGTTPSIGLKYYF